MRRRAGLFLAVAIVPSLLITASASGQGSTLQITPQTATPGQVVTASSFGGYATAAGVSDVSIRLSTRNGQILRTTSPTPQGSIDTTFLIPAGLSPGWYLVLATQTTANGRQRQFTPGRTRIHVVAAARPLGAAGASSPGIPPPALWAGALVLLALLATGATVAARRSRTLSQPPGPAPAELRGE